MIYVTGDIHREIRDAAAIVEKCGITADDVLVILGDVCVNYYGKHGDRQAKKKLNRLGVPILCIHGNHEMRPTTIPTYHEEEWQGGIVYKEDEFPFLNFAKDGEIYSLEGNRVIALGGAYSVDKWHRLRMDMNWFADEQPSEEIKQYAEQKLEAAGWDVDVVLSHTCPRKYEPVEAYLTAVDQSLVDKSTEEWLDRIEEKLSYRQWFCGHWHINKHIDKIHFLFHDVEVLACRKD